MTPSNRAGGTNRGNTPGVEGRDRPRPPVSGGYPDTCVAKHHRFMRFSGRFARRTCDLTYESATPLIGGAGSPLPHRVQPSRAKQRAPGASGGRCMSGPPEKRATGALRPSQGPSRRRRGRRQAAHDSRGLAQRPPQQRPELLDSPRKLP